MKFRPTALIAVAVILLLGTSDIFAQRDQTAEFYSVTASDFIYVPLAKDNADNFVDLSGETAYTGSAGTGTLLGDYDEGVILIGPFNAAPKSFPFTFGFMGDVSIFAAMGISTNGGVEFLRTTPTGGTLSGDPLWNPGGSGYYGNSQIWGRAFAFHGDLDMRSKDAGIFMGSRFINGKTYGIVEWRNAEFYFEDGGPISFQIFISNDSFTPEFHFVFGPNASTIPDQFYYTGLNDGTAASGTNVAVKKYNGQAGNYIAARWVNGQWESTSDASSTGGRYGTVAEWPTKNIRFCLSPDITAVATNSTLFDYTNNPLDVVAADAEVTKTYRVSNPATSEEPIKVTMDLSGAGADSYIIDPPMVAALDPGKSQIFNVTLKPAGFGEQEAEIEVGISTMDGSECPVVKPSGTVTMLGLVPGLVPIDEEEEPVVDFGEVGVNSNTLRFTDLFTNDSPGDIRYTFTNAGLAGTEFQLSDDAGNPVSSYTAVVGPGEAARVPVRFKPTDQGEQTGTIQLVYSDVNGRIFSNPVDVQVIGDATPTRIEFLINNEGAHAPDGSLLGRNGVAAVGETPNYRYFKITNTGAIGAINVENFMFYELDRSEPVNNRFRVRWSEGFGMGMPLMSTDFYVERNQNGSWVRVMDEDRITLDAKEGIELRVVFAPHRPGQKYVRMFFNTDATVDQKFAPIEALDPADMLTPQLLSYDLYGFGARNGRIEQVSSIGFENTEVGQPAAPAYLEIKNTGDARLLIDINSIKLLPGDHDFTVGDVFPNRQRTELGKAIIPVDSTGRIYMNFTPRRAGTRFTTLYFQSNDSTPTPEGLIGERYITVYGVGEANAKIGVTTVDAQPLFQNLSAIVDAPSTYKTADITVSHLGGPTLVITNLRLEGPDAADYAVVSTDNTGPLDELGSRSIVVQFEPKSEGPAKDARLVIESNAAEGDQIITLTGIADTRLVSAPATTLFVDARIGTDESITEMVEITNVGTTDLNLNAPVFSSGDYSSDFNGGTILVGESITINVTLSSTTSADKTGSMTIANNSTNLDPVEILLGGYVGLRRPDAQTSYTVMANWIRGEYVPEQINIDVTNIGDLPLTLDPASSNFSGANAGDFAIIDIPSTEIAPNGQVTVVVEFTPSSGNATATLNLASNGDPNPLEIDFNGAVTDVIEQAKAEGYALSTAAPNPVHNSTVVEFSIPGLQKVSLELFDMRGERVAVLVNQQMPGGNHSVNVNCENLPAGNYVYKLTTDRYELTETLQVVR